MVKFIYKFFASLKVAIFLIVIIAVISVVGTIIPQNREPIFYKSNYPVTWYYILLLDFDDLFRSKLYIGLLCILSISTIVCTYTRTKITLKRFRNRINMASVSEVASYKISTRIENSKLTNLSTLEKFEKRESENGTIYLRVSGKLSLLGSPLIHIGLLIILLGSIISHYTGFEMAITAVKGDKIPLPSLEGIKSGYKADKLRKKALKMQILYPNLQNLQIDKLKKQIQHLEEIYTHAQNNPKYWIVIKDLWVEYYDQDPSISPPSKYSEEIKTNSENIVVNRNDTNNSSDSIIYSTQNTKNHNHKHNQNQNQNLSNNLLISDEALENSSIKDNNSKSVKNWNSLIEVLNSNNEGIASGLIKVNHPLSFENFTLYQASWQKVYNKVTVLVTSNPISTEPANLATEPQILTLKLGEEVKPSWSSITFTLYDFMPDFRIIDNNFVSISDELRNPAARIVGYNQDGALVGRAWAFSTKYHNSGHIFSNLPYNFTFHSAEPSYQTGLQLCYDPYTWIVWLGCLLIIIGLFLTFYISYYEEWIVIRTNNLAIIAVSGNRPEANLKDKFSSLTKELNISS